MGERETKIRIIIYIFIILVITLLGVIYYYFVRMNGNFESGSKNEIRTKKIQEIKDDTNNVNKVNSELIEIAIKNALIQIAKDSQTVSENENLIYAEGHKILETEIIDDKVYAYITATYKSYKLTDETYETVSETSGPMRLTFTTSVMGDYQYLEYTKSTNIETLQEIFPSDLVTEAISANYGTEFYNKQINKYLEN